jgi:flagellar biogenesis protein FliO
MLVIVKAVLSLLFVLALLYIILKSIQKYGKIGLRGTTSPEGLQINSVLYIGDEAKIVSIQRGNNYYLIAMNKNNISLIDKYIEETPQPRLK